MAKKHGRFTQVSVDGDDLTAMTNTSTLTRGGDEHDLTTYGHDDQVVDGGLGKQGFTMGGWYETGSSATPRATLEPAVMTVVEIIRKPEGTGAGKPTQTFDALVKSYVETNPVNDFIQWSAEFTVSDGIVDTTQGA